MHQVLHLLMKGLTQDLAFLLGDLKNISRFLSVLTNPDSFLPLERRSKDLFCLLAITIGFQLTMQLVLLMYSDNFNCLHVKINKIINLWPVLSLWGAQLHFRTSICFSMCWQVLFATSPVDTNKMCTSIQLYYYYSFQFLCIFIS